MGVGMGGMWPAGSGHFVESSLAINVRYQTAKYNNSCLELAVLHRMSTNNPDWKSMVLESSVKPSLPWPVSLH